MSKVIAKEALGDCAPWEAPSVQVAAHGGASGHLLTAQHLDKLQKQAYEEGYALGRKEGLHAGQAEIHAQVQRLDQIMRALSAPFENLDEQVEQELLALTFTLVRQLVRREIKQEPGQIVAVVREAMASLPVSARNVRLHLHPEDAALVREALALHESEHTWRLMEDPVLTRGGCRVVTDASHIDASVETRLANLIATLLGGEREHDPSS